MKNSVTDLTFKEFESLKNITKKIEEKNSSSIDLEQELLLLLALTKKIDIKFLRKVNKISLRLGLLAILEEKVIETKIKDREYYKYDQIYLEANSKYTLSNRNKKRFPSLKDIHPEDPFSRFEDLNSKMKEYYNAISKVLLGSYWILDNKKAVKSLEEIYNEIKEAYNF